MKRGNKKTEPPTCDYIELDRQSFWLFNDGTNDRFGFFKEEEQKKIETEQKLQQNQTAYNYQRIIPEIEENEWLQFYQQLTDQFFKKYDYIRVHRNGSIYGMKKDLPRLLTVHPDAFRLAQMAKKNSTNNQL